MKLRVNPYRVAIHSLAVVLGGVLTAFVVFGALSDFNVDIIVPSEVKGNTVETVRWNVSSGVDSVDVYVSYDAGLSFTLLETSIPADSYFEWDVPNIGQNVRLRVDARNGSTKIRGRDVSDQIKINRDTASPSDSLKVIEGFDAVATYYPSREVIENHLPSGIEVGDLIRTRDLNAVYFVSGAGKRHAFPNETTYFTWFSGFDDVKYVSNETMSSLTLGEPVRVRPGTWLVKIQSANSVYAVEPGGGLVVIPSEEVAEKFYGPMWNKRIIDIPSAYFTYYSRVNELCATCSNHPIGSIIERSGEYFYMGEDGSLRPFEGEGFTANGFQEKFLVDFIDNDNGLIDGVPIRAQEEVLFDYQDIGR